MTKIPYQQTSIAPEKSQAQIRLTFDYSNFKPMNDHGSRFVHTERKDDMGYRLQVSAPWKSEGCDYDGDMISFAWAAKLTLRRDNALCQWCGEKGEEVHHIIPVLAIVRGQGYQGDYDRRCWTQYGNCGHNLVTLCHTCHKEETHPQPDPEIPPLLVRRLDEFERVSQ